MRPSAYVIPLKKLNLNISKIQGKFMDIYKLYLYNFQKIQFQIWNEHWETKKNLAWIVSLVSPEDNVRKMTLFISDFLFYFSMFMLDLELNFLKVVQTYLVDIHNLRRSFWNILKSWLFSDSLWSTLGGGSINIFSVIGVMFCFFHFLSGYFWQLILEAEIHFS